MGKRLILKRPSVIILVLICIISWMMPPPSLKAETGTGTRTSQDLVTWYEGFESYKVGKFIGGLNGWTLDSGSADIVASSAFAGEKKLQLNGNTGLLQNNLNLSRGAVSFWFKPENADTRFKDSGKGLEGAMFEIEVDSQNVTYTDGTARKSTKILFDSDKWYRFLIYFQSTSYTYKYRLVISDEAGAELGTFDHLDYIKDQQLKILEFTTLSGHGAGLSLDEFKLTGDYTYEVHDFETFKPGNADGQSLFSSSDQAVVTSDDAAAGDYSIKLSASGSDTVKFISGPLSPLSHYSVEWFWRADRKGHGEVNFRAKSITKDDVWQIGMGPGGEFKASDGSDSTSFNTEFTGDNWYKTRVDADLTTGKYDVTVWDANGTQIGRATDLNIKTDALATPTFQFDTDEKSQGIFWLDQITVYPTGGYHTIRGFNLINSHFDYGMDHNENGKLAWGNSFNNDAYMYMYRATKDTKYLDIVIDELDQMLKQRDNERNVADWKGEISKGWATAGRYNLGETTLKNANGADVLYIKSVRYGDQDGGTRFSADNDSIRIKITNYSEYGLFNMEVLSDTLGISNKYKNLSMDPNHPRYVENMINGIDPLIAVWDVSKTNDPPNNGTYSLNIGRYHTLVDHGRISQAYAAFARIVHENPDLLENKRYREKAKIYQEAAEDAVALFDPFWRENNQGEGWYVFEPGAPFWADGVDEPHNRYIALGHTMLDLYAVTGKEKYLDKVTKIARSFKNDLQYDAEKDLYLWTYARTKGYFYNGWTEADNISTNTKSFAGSSPLEDVSHARIEMTFVYWAMKDGIVFDETDLKRFANTFKKNVVQPDGTTAYRLDGSGNKSYNPWASGWLVLAEVDPDIYFLVKDIFDREQAQFFPSYLYGSAMLNWVRTQILLGISAEKIQSKVERFVKDGEFKNEDDAHLLQVHLIAVSHLENRGSAEKIVKHMKGFKLLLDHQKENGLISDDIYRILKADADLLITKWQNGT